MPISRAATSVGCLVAIFAATSVTAADPSGQLPSVTSAPLRGVGVYRGHLVEFENIEGWAIVEGDIILGRADSLEQTLAAPRSQAKGYTIDTSAGLWPKGPSGMFEVPYTIEVDANSNVPPAIATFNAVFAGFMQFVPRAAESDYVAFTLDLAVGSPACSSSIGRVGGRQVIKGPPACPPSSLIHEMGHAVGLWHEHQRPDRDQYVNWSAAHTAKNYRRDSNPVSTDSQTVGPYDFASIMHYGDFAFSADFQPTLVTIPQGIDIGDHATYSAGDIDTIRRLYGAVPAAITVTSDPPGLALTIDGQPITTPQTFSWPLNSTHTLDVPQLGQTFGALSYFFGRWNVDLVGDGQPHRTIVVAAGYGGAASSQASPGVTVYTAHFVRVFPFTLASIGDTPAAAAATTGAVTPQAQLYPGLTGSFVRNNQLLTLSASVGTGVEFAGWFGSDFAGVKDGFDANPLVVYPHDFNTGATVAAAKPYGSSAPILRFRGRANDGVVDGFAIQIDGKPAVRTPYTSTYGQLKAGETHQITAVATQTKNASTVRYQFADWDGSGVNSLTVVVPSAGEATREVTANFTAQYSVAVGASFSCAGSVTVSPSSADGFHPYGEQLVVTATPSPGWFLTGWTGDFTGTTTQRTTAVTGQVFAIAQFNTLPVPFALTGSSRAFATAGEPEFDLTLYGTGFTSATVVVINNSIRGAVLIDATRLRVHVSAADYAQPGEIVAAVANVASNCNNYASLSIPVRASGYAWPATTPIVEYYYAVLDHYFITANPAEIAVLDGEGPTGWVRTGRSFKAFPADSIALPTQVAKAVCRFYGSPAAGLDSHFYSAARDECDAVRQKFPDAWIFEGSDVFQMVFPDRTTGSCPDGTIPVYRLWNQRADVNHRYTTDPAVQAQMIAKGYVPEGYGASGVAMCTLA